MKSAEDLTGQVFGNLTVLFRDREYGKSKKSHGVWWKCKCLCGNEATIIASHLKSGKTKSCGCLVYKKESLAGNNYGRLTVLHRDQNNSGKWVCLCECGNTTSVYASSLKQGFTKSCGCYHREIVSNKLTKDLIGQKFGMLTVFKKAEISISSKGRTETQWLCRCDCGNEKIIKTRCLIQGSSNSCGCLKSKLSSERFSYKLEGQRFGKLFVLKRDENFLGEDGTQYSKWLCLCDCGTIKSIRGTDMVYGKVASCGCTISRGEEMVRKVLNSKNIKFDTQFGFKDLKSDKNRMLKFDIALLSNCNDVLALIEYQGIQHYVEQSHGFGKQQREITDPMKREYCQKNNIKLFEISYKDDIEESIENIISNLNISYVNPVPSLN